MIQWIAAIVFVLVAILPVNAIGDPGDVGPTIKKLEQAYESFQDMQAAFEQKTTSGAVALVQQAAGRVFFKKSGKMLWHYETPEEQRIILDGKTLWFYLPEEKQVMKNNFSIIPQHIVADLFRGKMDVLQKFKVQFASQEPGDAAAQVKLELVPIEPDPTVRKLLLWLDPTSYLVRKTLLTDGLGNRTELAFQDIKVDQGLADSLFSFTPPDDVDIFEPPQL